MRIKPPLLFAAFALQVLITAAWADQIVLRDGTVYSGKFIRGDSRSVDFQVLGRVEKFPLADVSRIEFKEPELQPSAATRTTPAAPAQLSSPPPEPEPYEEPEAVLNEPPPPPLARGTAVTLPVGTPVTIRTTTEIDTDRNRVGDVFDGILDEPLVWGNRTVVPRGATVKGRIAYAKESGKLSGQYQLVLELTELIAEGKSFMLRTSDYSEVGLSRGRRTAATVGGTAALGAIIGAIAGGGTGAAVGAASGAAVGTGVQVMTKGQVLRIPAETILEFRLQAPLEMNVP